MQHVGCIDIRGTGEQLHPLTRATTGDRGVQRLGHRRGVIDRNRRRGACRAVHRDRVGLGDEPAVAVRDVVVHHDRLVLACCQPRERRVVRVDQDLVVGDRDARGHRGAVGCPVDAEGHVLHVQGVARILIGCTHQQAIPHRREAHRDFRVQRRFDRRRMVGCRRVGRRAQDRHRLGLRDRAAQAVVDVVAHDDRLALACAKRCERRVVRVDQDLVVGDRDARRHRGACRPVVDAEGDVSRVQRVAVRVGRATQQLVPHRLATLDDRRMQGCCHRRWVVDHDGGDWRLDRDRVGLADLAAVPVVDRVVRDDRLGVAAGHAREGRAVRVDEELVAAEREATRDVA